MMFQSDKETFCIASAGQASVIRLSSAQDTSGGFSQSVGYDCSFLKDLKGLLETLPSVTLP